MNKLKLVQIILKDLEEIKLLSEEVAESENDSALIVDLALSRTRLLCQEFELLREMAVQVASFNEETEDDLVAEDEFEVTDVSFSDPELEILNFEENEFPEDEELSADQMESENEEPDEEIQEEDLDDIEEEEEELTEEADEETAEEFTEEEAEEEEEDTEELEEEDDLTEEDEDEETDEDESEMEEEDEEVDEDEDEEFQQEANIGHTAVKEEPKTGYREIQIDEADDEDLETIKFSPHSGSVSRPVMHEIPKPENPVQEKTVVGESFQKERSVNDVIGENKAGESNLNNGPISSLRASIGLNDRFLFIREIFNNNTDKYNTVIDQLDQLETIQQAVELLKANLSLEKNETSLKFVDLLKRRFSK